MVVSGGLSNRLSRLKPKAWAFVIPFSILSPSFTKSSNEMRPVCNSTILFLFSLVHEY